MERKEYEAPQEGFPFTERERLFNHVANARFEALVFAPQTHIHRVTVGSNLYGEYLFVTASRPFGQGRTTATFYGLGYHNRRERWITEAWFWFPEPTDVSTDASSIDPNHFRTILHERRTAITPLLTQDPQTSRGILFELLADLTDEDSALAELDDLEALGFDLDDADFLR